MTTDDYLLYPRVHRGRIPLDHHLVHCAREVLHLTQRYVADYIGATFGTYVNWETGAHQPQRCGTNFARMEKLADVLRLEDEDIVIHKPMPFPSRRLDKTLLHNVRVEFGNTRRKAVKEVGLLDPLFYREWEDGKLNRVGPAYQYRLLVSYSEWIGEPFESLFLPEVRPWLNPCPAQWPPLAAPFVGRREALNRLGEWRTSTGPETALVLAVRGPSGVGKTALLAELLCPFKDKVWPFGVLFWSFSTNPRVDEFLDAALTYFAPDTVQSHSPSLERLIDCLGRWDPREHLLVLDGLEAVQNPEGPPGSRGALSDPSVGKLLCRIAAGLGRTRVLAASRLPLPELASGPSCRSLELADLAHAQARDLLARLGLPAAEIADGLIAGFGARPLSLRILASLARVAPIPPATGREPDLDAVLQPCARYLSDLERDLMRVLAALPRDASLTILLDVAQATARFAGALAGATSQHLGEALARLEALGLVSVIEDGTRYRLHAAIRAWWSTRPPHWVETAPTLEPLPRGPAGSAGKAAATWRWQLALLSLNRGRAHAKRLRTALKSLFAESTDQDAEGIGPLPGSLEELRAVLESLGIVQAAPERPPNLWESPLRTGAAPAPGLDDQQRGLLIGLFESAVGAGRADLAFEIYQGYLGGYAELGHRAGRMLLGERLLRQLAGIGEGQDQVQLPPGLSPAQRFRIAFDWGLFRGAMGGVVGEIACYRAALAQTAGESLGEVVARRALAYAERQQGHLETALVTCNLSRDTAITAGDLSLDQVIAARLAQQRVFSDALRARLLHDLGRVKEAEKAFRELCDPLAHSRLAALSGVWQAEQALDLGRLETCVALGGRVLSNGKALGDEGLMARCHIMLGLSRVRRDRECAQGHLDAAQPWIDRTDHTELRLRAQELRSCIAGERGQGRSAFFEAFKGLRLAEDCGYGLIQVRLAVLVLRWAVQCRTPAILRRSCELVTSALEQGCPDYAWGRADALHWLGIARWHLGDTQEARATLQEALRERKALGHPETADTLRALRERFPGGGPGAVPPSRPARPRHAPQP